MQDLKVAHLHEDRLDDYFEFRRRVHPSGPKQLDRERWAWWFRDNPQVPERTILTRIILDGEEIVGAQSPVPVQLKVGAQTVRGAFWNDFFVDETRKLGLMALRLYKTGEAEYDVNLQANVSDSARQFFRKMGYADLSEHVRCLTAYFPANLRVRVGPASRLRHGWYDLKRRLRPQAAYDMQLVDAVPPTVDDLWRRVASERTVTVVKDREYLAWRYERCPVRDYRFLTVRAGESVAALAVVSTTGEPGTGTATGLVSDLLVPPTDLAAARAAVGGCLDHFRAAGCGSCATHVLDAALEPRFLEAGFRAGPSELGLLLRAMPGRLSDPAPLEDLAELSFWPGDSDRW